MKKIHNKDKEDKLYDNIIKSIDSEDKGEVIIHASGCGKYNKPEYDSSLHSSYENQSKYFRRYETDKNVINSWNLYGEMNPNGQGHRINTEQETLLDQLIHILESQLDFSANNHGSIH
mmetsp:Transcript_3368/g.4725  ORF Transcript_3368/g.4725 Transcript_3368/m.4725 type:complete len:118 (+) Transcript_3368:200-553(+)